MEKSKYIYSRELRTGEENIYDTGRRTLFSRLITKGPFKKIPHQISAFIIFLIPLYLILFIFNPTIWGFQTGILNWLEEWHNPLNLTVQIIFWISIPVGVILIKWEEDHTFWELWHEVRNLVKLEENEYKELVAKYEKRFYSRKWVILWGFCLFLFALSLIIANFLQLNLFFTYPFYYILFFVIQIFCYGILFWVIIAAARGVSTIRYVTQDLKNQEYNVNPLDPDRFGGFSTIGEVAIEITLVTSAILTFYLPWAVYIVLTAQPTGIMAIYFIVLSNAIIIGTVIVILYTFLRPTINIHRIAKRERDKVLIDAAEKYEKEYNKYLQYREAIANTEKSDREIQTLIEMGTWVNLQNNRYAETEKMRVYPYTTKTIIKLLSSLSIPVIVGILNQVLILPILS